MDLMNNKNYSNTNNNNNNYGDMNMNNFNNGNIGNTINNNVMEQNVIKQNEQKRDLDYNLEEGDILRIDDGDVANPCEMDNNNNKMEDKGSQVKKNKVKEDDWDF